MEKNSTARAQYTQYFDSQRKKGDQSLGLIIFFIFLFALSHKD